MLEMLKQHKSSTAGTSDAAVTAAPSTPASMTYAETEVVASADAAVASTGRHVRPMRST